MAEKRPSVIAVTENGTTRYGIAGNYGGLVGIALRLLKNAKDGGGSPVPYFDRLVPIKEVEKSRFLDYAGRPADADELFCFAEIDVDENVIRIDEDMKEEREYHEYPLDRLLDEAVRLRQPSSYSGYGAVNKKILYSVMNTVVKSMTGNLVEKEKPVEAVSQELNGCAESVEMVQKMG